MNEWYLSYDGQMIGPFDQATAAARAQQNPNGHCWRQGFPEWLPINQVRDLSANTGAVPPAAPAPQTNLRSADVIDYKIVGHDMQFVEIELDPGESVIAEAGALMYKDAVVQLETVFGDSSYRTQSGTFMDKLISAGKRVITGEGLFTTLFTHGGASGKARVAFAAPFPGTIMPVSLADHDGRVICQKDSFLCGARGVSLGIFFQRKILTGLFGGEGFIMEKLEGDGMVFMHAGGTMVERVLAPGERVDVDTGCVVGFTDKINFDVQPVGGIKSMLFGGEGVFLATLTGPGKVWLQSLPFSRLAGRMLASAPQRGGSRDEGSVLGGLGTILGGDRLF